MLPLSAPTSYISQEDERLPKINEHTSFVLDKNLVATCLVYPAIRNQLGHAMHEDIEVEAYFSTYWSLPRAKLAHASMMEHL